MRLLVVNLILMFLFVTSCKTTNNSTSGENSVKDVKKNTVSPVVIINDFSAESSLKVFEVQKASIAGNILSVTLSYTGCSNDVIDLVFTGSYLKSYPMKAQLYVKRTPGKEGCDKKIVKDFQFDLSSIKPAGGKTLIILMQNFNENLTYQY